ncbi:MAG: SOS response-associated peptidase [Opitutaceae bacterium]|nr:SOS response-associated peptidase [Opitutaceae bacterium]
MCYRYLLQVEALQALAERLEVICPAGWRSRYNLAPGEPIPVVRMRSAATAREVAMLRWGLVPGWARENDAARAPANARAESLADRPTFRDAYRHRRCLIPASGFYEWQGRGRRRQPYLFRLRGEAAFGFAGLWEAWPDPASGRKLETCAIITTAPNELMRPIHDRMPAILALEDCGRWLDSRRVQPRELAPLLRPFPAEAMTATPLTNRVNNLRHDDPACLEPAPALDRDGDPAQLSLGW